MDLLKSAPAVALKSALPTPIKSALKRLLRPDRPKPVGSVKVVAPKAPAGRAERVSLTGKQQRILVPPSGVVELGVQPTQAVSVMQVRFEHAGMSSEEARLLLEGIDKQGRVKTRRWIKDEKRHYKTSFLTNEDETSLSFRLTNKAKQGAGDWIDLVSLDCVRVQDKPRNNALLEFSDESVTVSMATYPMREKTFPDAVESLVDQCDNLLIYLNNYREVPAFLVSHPQRHKIHYILDTASELRAAAKFTWANRPGYHVICDDDIIYPPDYTKTLISKVETYGRKAVVGVHAANLLETIPTAGNHRSEVLRFQEAESADRAVNLLGTGTIGYHADTVSDWDWSVLIENRISNDEAVAVLAKNSGVPLVAIARPDGWMKSHEDMVFGIYEEKSLMPETHARVLKFLRDNEPWPKPVLPRKKAD